MQKMYIYIQIVEIDKYYFNKGLDYLYFNATLIK